MNTPSLKKTRAAVGDIIGVVKNHAMVLDGLTKAVQGVGSRGNETREALSSFLGLGIVGRFRWLLTGVVNGATDSSKAAGSAGE